MLQVTLVLVVLLSFQDVGFNDAFNMEDEPNYRYVYNVYPFKVKTIDGEEFSMEKYRGYVLIIVNVASKCDYAERTYQELNILYDKYRHRGLRILAFPCNNYLQLEPGDPESIRLFAKEKNVTFDIFEKTTCIGRNTTNLFKFLIYNKPGPDMHVIKWNFEKFIVSRYGRPVARYDCDSYPLEMEKDLLKQLAVPVPKPPPSTTPRNKTKDYEDEFTVIHH